MHAKAAPLQAVGITHYIRRGAPIEDEDDDEYEDECNAPVLDTQEFPLPIHQYPRSRFWLAGDCLENTPGRDDGWIQT